MHSMKHFKHDTINIQITFLNQQKAYTPEKVLKLTPMSADFAV